MVIIGWVYFWALAALMFIILGDTSAKSGKPREGEESVGKVLLGMVMFAPLFYMAWSFLRSQ